ncbi:DUF2628 domain-containing protein [Methylomonas sp. TEB]|uniref:DUF2628 domain-containing protein n=1 Tax=Methylomonas sp. TEB TaxID=3398229 RepID=UPI0039F60B52
MGGYESISQNPTTDNLGLEEKFYKAILGNKKQQYYLLHFSQFHNQGKVEISWHWSAFFFTFFWFIYRKLWVDAILYCFWSLFVFAVDMTIHLNGVLYFLGVFVLPAMYANAIYYIHCKEKILAVKTSSQTLQEQLDVLSRKGGTSANVLSIVVILLLILILKSIRVPIA